MTIKEFEKINQWLKADKRAALTGYILLYPEAIKHIKEPTDYMIELATKRRSLYFSVYSGKVDGNYFILNDYFKKNKLRIRFNHVQYFAINKYNH